MVAAAITGNKLTQRINVLCLIAAMVIILVLPSRKEIWYDETVSILCSKGISHDTQAEFANAVSISSAQIEQLNTSARVFEATIIDNANSFLYNYKLHWFTDLFGNSPANYMLLSKLCALITLVALFFLCRQFFRDSLFTGLTILLLALDMNFVSMSHEIRAYSMGTMFVVLAAVFFFRYLWQRESAVYLFLVSFFLVCALLCHFLAGYIALVFVAVLLIMKRQSIFTVRSVFAIIIPLIPLGVFLYYAYNGLKVMGSQSKAIEEGYANYGFKLSEVFLRSMEHMAYNFKVVVVVFTKPGVVIISFLLVPVLYITGLWASGSDRDKKNLHILFASGAISSIVLMLLSVKAQHYTSLYFRYHSFAVPFSTLFIGYLLYVMYGSNKLRSFVRIGLPVLFVLPCIVLFTVSLLYSSSKPSPYQTFVYKAKDIENNKLTTCEVGKWEDAFLIQSLLPKGYKIDYFRAR